jgi:hypothetical protein
MNVNEEINEEFKENLKREIKLLVMAIKDVVDGDWKEWLYNEIEEAIQYVESESDDN